MLAPQGNLVGQAGTEVAIDTVEVGLLEGAATVRHRILPVGGIIEAYAITIPDQAVEVTTVLGPAGPLEFTVNERAGAQRIAVASSRPVVVEYDVIGDVERIPLFVSGGGAVLTVSEGVEEPFLIRVSGEGVDRFDTQTSMPRFARLQDGGLEVRLSSLPSFVRLSEGGPLSFARLADAIALLLIAVGGMVVFRRLRAAAAA